MPPTDLLLGLKRAALDALQHSRVRDTERRGELVNGDGLFSPLDALLIINKINRDDLLRSNDVSAVASFSGDPSDSHASETDTDATQLAQSVDQALDEMFSPLPSPLSITVSDNDDENQDEPVEDFSSILDPFDDATSLAAGF